MLFPFHPFPYLPRLFHFGSFAFSINILFVAWLLWLFLCLFLFLNFRSINLSFFLLFCRNFLVRNLMLMHSFGLMFLHILLLFCPNFRGNFSCFQTLFFGHIFSSSQPSVLKQCKFHPGSSLCPFRP